MQKYTDLSGHSGVLRYASATTHIDIEWKDGKIYRYNDFRPGAIHVEKMKQLAASGQGLATYINRYVRQNFAEQMK